MNNCVNNQVKIWFQNRRMKWKRSKKAQHEMRTGNKGEAVGNNNNNNSKSSSRHRSNQSSGGSGSHNSPVMSSKDDMDMSDHEQMSDEEDNDEEVNVDVDHEDMADDLGAQISSISSSFPTPATSDPKEMYRPYYA